jgi:hypothetical protein
VTKSQRALDGATKRFNDFERADAKRTEESKAAKSKAKKLRTKRDKDAAALQVSSSVAGGAAPMKVSAGCCSCDCSCAAGQRTCEPGEHFLSIIHHPQDGLCCRPSDSMIFFAYRMWSSYSTSTVQKCEDDVERLPGEIEAHQARVAHLTEELAGAEAEVERLAEAARPEREALTKKQQVGAALTPGFEVMLLQRIYCMQHRVPQEWSLIQALEGPRGQGLRAELHKLPVKHRTSARSCSRTSGRWRRPRHARASRLLSGTCCLRSTRWR